MHHTYKILSVLLALMLVGSNMAYSGHVSSHTDAGSGSCFLCIHPGGSDSAIVPEPIVFIIELSEYTLSQGLAPEPFLSIISHDHQSRAPPRLTWF